MRRIRLPGHVCLRFGPKNHILIDGRICLFRLCSRARHRSYSPSMGTPQPGKVSGPPPRVIFLYKSRDPQLPRRRMRIPGNSYSMSFPHCESGGLTETAEYDIGRDGRVTPVTCASTRRSPYPPCAALGQLVSFHRSLFYSATQCTSGRSHLEYGAGICGKFLDCGGISAHFSTGIALPIRV